jgi:hypothetical protein
MQKNLQHMKTTFPQKRKTTVNATHGNSKIAQQYKGTTNVNMKIQCFTTEPHYQKYWKHSQVYLHQL